MLSPPLSKKKEMWNIVYFASTFIPVMICRVHARSHSKMRLIFGFNLTHFTLVVAAFHPDFSLFITPLGRNAPTSFRHGRTSTGFSPASTSTPSFFVFDIWVAYFIVVSRLRRVDVFSSLFHSSSGQEIIPFRSTRIAEEEYRPMHASPQLWRPCLPHRRPGARHIPFCVKEDDRKSSRADSHRSVADALVRRRPETARSFQPFGVLF